MSQQALVVENLGEPVVLKERAIPEPTEGEVLIKIQVAGFNPHDSYSWQWGLFIGSSLPSPLAIDIVGTVAKLGPGVQHLQLNDRVFYLGVPTDADRNGTQEYALAKADYTAKAPARLSGDEIATMILNPWTAFLALFSQQGLEIPSPVSPERKTFDYASKTVLVIGGGSACGKFVIQWAKYVGIGTIITVASKEKSERELKELGATHVVDRHGSLEALDKQVRDVVGDELVYTVDCVGKGPGGHTPGVKALSSQKKGTLVVLAPRGDVDETQIGEKTAGYEKRVVSAGKYDEPDLVKLYFSKVGEKMEDGTILPTPFSVIKGLDAGKVNEVLVAYGDGTGVVKPHVHP